MYDANYWLATPRLGLRRFAPGDVDWLAELYRDEHVMRYLGGVKNRVHVEEFLRHRILRYYEEHPNLGIWMTMERATATPIGFHLLNHIRGEPIVQVGFTLVSSAWGKGFATEMATALLRYGFVDLKLPRITGMANIANVGSQRVLQKIGLERHGERSFPHPHYASQGPMAWFERSGPEWLAERGGLA
jgi:ribosomal-protein-alanine N-acetyltransferase